jgi:hypothetical protein
VVSAGKVRKNILKDLVCRHFGVINDNEDKEVPSDPLTPPSSVGAAEELALEELKLQEAEIDKTIQQLADIWLTLVLNAPGRNDTIFDFADSITLLRYTDKI